MNRKLMLSLSVCLLIVASCKKQQLENEEPEIKTPLHEVLDSKYITYNEPLLDVSYTTYKPGFDIDKRVFEAAQQTVGSTQFTKVYIWGTRLYFIFQKGAARVPAYYGLMTNTEAHNEANKDRKWRGRLTIINNNSFLSKEDFEKAVNITLYGANVGDKITTVEKIITKSLITVVFEMTKSFNDFQKINFKVQSNAPVSYSIKYDIQYSMTGSTSMMTLDYPTDSNEQPKITEIAQYTTEFSGATSSDGAKLALSEYLAKDYWNKDVVPQLK